MTRVHSPWKKRLAQAAVVFGMLLMLYMIVYEDEPGALPLIMIVVGSAYLIWRAYQGQTSD